MATSKKFIPGSEADAVEIFQYPFFIDDESKEFIKNHRRIMFIVRGPPGTAKSSLTDLFLQHYSSCVKCSADDYFKKTFASSMRTKKSLKESHMYCHKRVEQECLKGSHPVIVVNTHVKKSEMQEYLNYAEKYGYTVIVANTLDKFEVSPKILAKSNTKGLDKSYFERRMRNWQDIYPQLMGWFLNGEDSHYVLHQLQCALVALFSDGRFCNVFNIFDKDKLLKRYKAKEMLFCIAGFMKRSPFELKEYYMSEKIREAYGKCFHLFVQAYVITTSDIFAIIPLDGNLKAHIFKPNFENNSQEEDKATDIVTALRNLSFERFYSFKLISLNDKFLEKGSTVVLTDKSNDSFNISESSFIHIAQTEEKKFSVWDLNKLLKSCFDSIVNENGELLGDKFTELEDGYKFCRLTNDAWVVRPPKDLSVKTVFTGLYI